MGWFFPVYPRRRARVGSILPRGVAGRSRCCSPDPLCPGDRPYAQDSHPLEVFPRPRVLECGRAFLPDLRGRDLSDRLLLRHLDLDHRDVYGDRGRGVDGRRPYGQEGHRHRAWNCRGHGARRLGPATLERWRPVRAGGHLRQAVVFGHPPARHGYRATVRGGSAPCTPGCRQRSRGSAIVRGSSLHARAGTSFDLGCLPDLLPPHRERRPDEHRNRHATRAHLRAVVRHLAPRRTVRSRHAGRARNNPPERRPHHGDRSAEGQAESRSAWVEDHLRAAEQGNWFAVLVRYGSIPHLGRAATVDELRFAGDRTVTFGPDEVTLQLYGREALCSFWQVHERTVAAGGICQGDHRRGVQVPVWGHELITEVEAARDPTLFRLQYLQPDETRQGSDTTLVQLVEKGHATHLQGSFRLRPIISEHFAKMVNLSARRK